MSEILLYSTAKRKQTVGHYDDKTFWQVERMYHSNFPSDVHHKGLSEKDYVQIKEQTWFLVSRAYQNIYGISMPQDPQYQQTLLNAALSLRVDDRASSMSERELLHVFEDIIRISDEHQREAQQHLAKASNAVYLREMALDNAVENQKYQQAMNDILPASKAAAVSHTGRLNRTASGSSSMADIIDVSMNQIAIDLEKAGS